LLIAQSAVPSESKIKAVFLYNFTRFIDWPGNAFTSTDNTFKIGIVGTDPFGDYLEEAVRNESVSGKPIVIERFRNVKDIKDCQILYINSKDHKEIRNIIETVKQKKILTVCANPEFMKWGGMIRIYSDDNKIRMQINDAAARNEDIKISAKRLTVAEVYYP
jgi:hypothetical protein